MSHPVQAGTEAAHIHYDEPERAWFTAVVTAIRELARINGRQVWQIALDRTTFQPCAGKNRGILTATARSGRSIDVPVTAVEQDDSGETWHTADKPLQEGTLVRGRVSG